MFLSCSHLQVSPDHLSVEMLSCVFDFVHYLMDAPNGREMLCQIVEQLLLSAGLWVKTRGQVNFDYVQGLFRDVARWGGGGKCIVFKY